MGRMAACRSKILTVLYGGQFFFFNFEKCAHVYCNLYAKFIITFHLMFVKFVGNAIGDSIYHTLQLLGRVHCVYRPHQK